MSFLLFLGEKSLHWEFRRWICHVRFSPCLPLPGVLKFTLAWLQSHRISLKIKLDSTLICNENFRERWKMWASSSRVGWVLICVLCKVTIGPKHCCLFSRLNSAALQRKGKIMVTIKKLGLLVTLKDGHVSSP